jgi:hypothetical protein
MISSQKRRQLDHEAGLLLKYGVVYLVCRYLPTFGM